MGKKSSQKITYSSNGGTMKKFFHDYSYSVVKMFINQLAIAIFGTSLTFATVSVHGDSGEFDVFTLIVSIFSALFYLFLIYNISWEIGAKDRISVDVKKKPYRPYWGLVLSLLANIPNLILVTVYAIVSFVGTSNAKGIVRIISCFVNGMYFGLLSVVRIFYDGEWIQLQAFWVSFLIAILPAIITSGLAYFCGHKNFKFFGFITNKKPNVSSERPNMK